MMQQTPKSSVMTANTKPNNVFYIWYTELCRRLNSKYAAIIRPSNPKCNTVLDFVADRLKFDDWSPLLNALRHDTSLHVINIRSRMSNCQFLHEVDTEDKARRMKRKYGALWTDFILNSLVRALSFSMKKTQVLTCLELDGLPIFDQYLDGLLKAFMENRTLKILSLTNCSIQDAGCRSVCSCLQILPNVEWLNLSRCDLSSVSGIYIAKLIKFQQLNRYTTSWHKSLRYSEPDSEKMCGIRRVTLNCNPKFGDEGLSHVLDELEDDLWIKALDVQKCGITEEISNKILDILQYNRSLKIADFRQNEDLHPCTQEKILDILSEKDVDGDQDSEFYWCNSVLSMNPSTIASSRGLSVFMDKTMILTPSRVTKTPINRSKTSIDLARRGKNGFCDTSTAKNVHRKKLIEAKLVNITHDVSKRDSEIYCNVVKKKDVKKSTILAPTTPINRSKTSIDISRRGKNGFCDTSTAKDVHRKKFIEVKLMNSTYDVNRRDSEIYDNLVKKKDIKKTTILSPTTPINRSKTSIDIARRGKNGFCDTSTAKDVHRKKLIEVKLMNSTYDVNKRDSEVHDNITKEKEVEIRKSVRKMNPRLNRQSTINHTNITNNIVKTFGKLQISRDRKEAPNNTPANSPIRKKEAVCKHANGVRVNGLRNGFVKEEVPLLRSASCLFEIMMSGKPEEETFDDLESLLSPHEDPDGVCKLDKSDLSDSQVSLLNYMQGLK